MIMMCIINSIILLRSSEFLITTDYKDLLIIINWLLDYIFTKFGYEMRKS